MTKKILIISFATLIFFANAFAQQTDYKKFEFGAEVGYNTATITNPGNYVTNPKNETGINAGVFAEYLFSDGFGLKIKAVYDQKGYDGYPFYQGRPISTSVYGSIPLSIIDYKLNYLTVPVVADFHIGKKKNWYINCGPYIGFLLNSLDVQHNVSLQSEYNHIDAGANLGVGIKFPLAKKIKLFVEFDGQHSLVNIINQDGVPSNGNFENSRSAFNVGVNF